MTVLIIDLSTYYVLIQLLLRKYINKKLGHFVEWYRKTNKLPSLSQLATADLPKGRGGKGGQPPRKKQKKAPISTRVDTIQSLHTGP